MKKLMWSLLGAISLALITSGCTREAEKPSKINLALKNILNSKIGSMTIGSDVVHIALNIHGGPYGTFVWNWDSHHNGQQIDPPDYVRVEVAKGTGRLIQILIVSELANGGMSFSYGDVVKDLVADFESVNITVNNVGASTTQAQVGGRYLIDGSSGPTGQMELLFTPPDTARPKMKIMESSMINGWFNIFLIDGAPFSYRFKHDGWYLFGGNINYTSEPFSPTSDSLFSLKQRVLHLVQPPGISVWNDGGSVRTESRDEERIIVGFFGPGADSEDRAVCYDINADSVPNFYSTFSDDGNSDNDTLMQYSPSPTAGAVTRLNNSVGLGNTGICADGGIEYSTILRIDGKKAGSGKGRVFGFESIFKITGSNHDSIQAIHSSGNLNLHWEYLPGVIGDNGATGVTIFYNTNPGLGDIREDGDGINCSMLSSLGFSYHDRPGDTVTNPMHTIPMSSGDYANAKVAICPYKVGYLGQKFYFNGVEVWLN